MVQSYADLVAALQDEPSHSRRMQMCARIGRAKEAGFPSLLKEATEKSDAWAGVYVVVLAQASKNSAALQHLVREHESFNVRARASQSLGKVDQPAVVSMLMDDTVPVQLRPILLKGCQQCTGTPHPPADVLNRVLDSPWGGPAATLELLQRCPADAVHAAVSVEWLPRLLSLCTVVRKVTKGSTDKLPDGQHVLQSFASKHPDVVAGMMKTNFAWGDRWYRALQLLSKSRPADVLDMLRKVKGNEKAAWMLARPLTRHRPRETLDVLIQRKKFDDVSLKCITKLVDGHQIGGKMMHRSEVLEATEKMVLGQAESPDDSLRKLLTLVLHPRRRACANGLVWTVAAKMMKNTSSAGFLRQCRKTPPSDDQLARVVGSARHSASAVNQLFRELRHGCWDLSSDRLAKAWEASGSVPRAKTATKLLGTAGNGADQFMMGLPKPARDAVARELIESKDFPDWDTSYRVAVLRHLPIKEVFPKLKRLASDRDAGVRAKVYSAFVECAATSGDTMDTLTFVAQRVENEQVEVKTPVLQALLRLPTAMWNADHLLLLNRLLEATIRWVKQGTEPWGAFWYDWVKRIVGQELKHMREHKALSSDSKLIQFSVTVTEQLESAMVAKEDSASILHGAAAALLTRRKEREEDEIIDPRTHPCIPFAMRYLTEEWLAPQIAWLQRMDPIVRAPPGLPHHISFLRTPPIIEKKRQLWPAEDRPSLLLKEVSSFVAHVGAAAFLRSDSAKDCVAKVLEETVSYLPTASAKYKLIIAHELLTDWVCIARDAHDLLLWQPLRQALMAAIGVVRRFAGSSEVCQQSGTVEPDAGWAVQLLSMVWSHGKHKVWAGTVALHIAEHSQGQLEAMLRTQTSVGRGLLKCGLESADARIVASWVRPKFAWLYDELGDAVGTLVCAPRRHEGEAFTLAEQVLQSTSADVFRWSPRFAAGTCKAAATCVVAQSNTPRIVHTSYGYRSYSGGPQSAVDPGIRCLSVALDRLQEGAKSRYVVKGRRFTQGVGQSVHVCDPLCTALAGLLPRVEGTELAQVINAILRMASNVTPEYHDDRARRQRDPVMPTPATAKPNKERRPRYRWQRGKAASKRKSAKVLKKREGVRDKEKALRRADYACVQRLVGAAATASHRLWRAPKSSGEENGNGSGGVLMSLTQALRRMARSRKLSERESEMCQPLVTALRAALDCKETRTSAVEALSHRTEASHEPFASLFQHALSLPVCVRELTVSEKKCRPAMTGRDMLMEGIQTRGQLLATYLKPGWLRRVRVQEILSRDAPSTLACPERVVHTLACPELAGYLVTHRQDLLGSVFDPDAGALEYLTTLGGWPLVGIVEYSEHHCRQRFPGQCGVAHPLLFTVQPPVQRKFYDLWLQKYAFGTHAPTVTGWMHDSYDCEDIGTEEDVRAGVEMPAIVGKAPRGEVALGHKRQAALLWAVCSLPCPAGLPGLLSKDNPVTRFLEECTTENETHREGEMKDAAEHKQRRQEGTPAPKRPRKSAEEIEASTRKARRSKLVKELINALRMLDYSKQAAETLSRHVTSGLSTYARPGLCDSLRCLPAKPAAAIIDEVLLRKHKRMAGQLAAGVGARSQLCRAAVRLCLPVEFVEPVLLREWECKGVKPPGPGGAPSDPDEEDDGSAKDVRINIIVSLASSPVTRKSEKLRELMMTACRTAVEKPDTDERVVMKELLGALTGNCETKSLNQDTWPRASADGLAGICAQLATVKVMRPKAMEALERWQKALAADTSSRVSKVDADHVVAATAGSMDETTAAPMMSLLLTLEKGGCNGAWVDAVRRLVEAALKAKKARVGRKKEMSLRVGIDAVAELPNWQLRGSDKATAAVADFLIAGREFAGIGIALRVNLMDFTAPLGPEALAAELRDLAAQMDRGGDWRAAAEAADDQLNTSITRQGSAFSGNKADQLFSALASVAKLLEEDEAASVRWLVLSIAKAVLEMSGMSVDPAVIARNDEWMERLYELRKDESHFVASAANKAFGEVRVRTSKDEDSDSGSDSDDGDDDSDDDDDDCDTD